MPSTNAAIDLPNTSVPSSQVLEVDRSSIVYGDFSVMRYKPIALGSKKV